MSRTDHHRPWTIRAADPFERVGYFSHCTLTHIRYGECRPGYCMWFMTHRQLSPPPSWYTHVVWHSPERRRERDDLRDAVKEYRANGDVEGDFGSWQHRSGAKWQWC